MDTIRKRLIINDEKVELTKKEFEILKLLLENQGKVFSRDEILDNSLGQRRCSNRKNRRCQYYEVKDQTWDLRQESKEQNRLRILFRILTRIPDMFNSRNKFRNNLLFFYSAIFFMVATSYYCISL